MGEYDVGMLFARKKVKLMLMVSFTQVCLGSFSCVY